MTMVQSDFLRDHEWFNVEYNGYSSDDFLSFWEAYSFFCSDTTAIGVSASYSLNGKLIGSRFIVERPEAKGV